jgi:hypothetical protein
VVGWDAPDTTAPTVSLTTPANAALGVALNTPISATFSEEMAPVTVNGATFLLEQDSMPVPGTVMYVGVTAVFMPVSNLAPATLYTATITAAVMDLAGNAMLANYTWSFTTGADVDAVAPWVTATNPPADATNVSINAAFIAVFSEAMAPATIDAATFTVMVGTTPVPGSVILVGVTALFTPTGRLAPDTLYTATITTGAKDLAGNAMAANYVWSFTTGVVLDETAPFVTATHPAHDATDVPTDWAVFAVFSEAMDPLTISTATFTLLDGTIPVDGTVIHDGVAALFTPTLPLNPDTLYTATLTTGVKDLAGNAMAAAYVWAFTTGTGPIVDSDPMVIATSPIDDAVDVPLKTPIFAVFSEAMALAAINTTTFTLAAGTTPVLGAVTYAGVTAFFTPKANLAPETLYTATITVGATDLDGNPLAVAYVWTFKTGLQPDAVLPSVTSTLPKDDDTNVPLGINIVAIFSEAMAPATIVAANFTVQQLDSIVAGAVTYVGVTGTFNPTAPLAPNTTYSVTVTTAAMDLAGNSLAQNFVWNFKTGDANDTTRPTVLSTIPADGDIDVALDTDVSATFSESMDSLTLTGLSFTLLDGLVPVLGVVTSIGNTVTLNPGADLLPDTEYMATITTVAADLSGNTLAADTVWNFTTGAAIDLIAPTVISTNPMDLAFDVPLKATVNATFSKDMDPLTITTATFKVAGPALSEVSGQVLYDSLGRIGTFTPDNDLMPATLYTATIAIEAKDLTGNALLLDYVWSFSTGEDSLTGILPVNLGSLTTFVAVAGAGLTNSNSSGITTLNGDVGLSPTGKCEGDGSPCSIINPVINGTLYINDPEGVAAKAKVDLVAAYVDASTRPVGTTVNDISGMVLAPGVYTSGSTMSIAVGGTVTLDGMGDANSVFIFQIGSSLTVNNNAQVLLINGAKAKNVFWAVFASSTLGSNVAFQGSVLAGASNSVGTDSTVIGRLLCTTGEITLLSNTITLPPL